jgi:hypothetical protein
MIADQTLLPRINADDRGLCCSKPMLFKTIRARPNTRRARCFRSKLRPNKSTLQSGCVAIATRRGRQAEHAPSPLQQEHSTPKPRKLLSSGFGAQPQQKTTTLELSPGPPCKRAHPSTALPCQCRADPQGSHRQGPALLSGIPGPTGCIPFGFRIRNLNCLQASVRLTPRVGCCASRPAWGRLITPPHPLDASFRCPRAQGCGNAKRTCNVVRVRPGCRWADQTS